MKPSEIYLKAAELIERRAPQFYRARANRQYDTSSCMRDAIEYAELGLLLHEWDPTEALSAFLGLFPEAAASTDTDDIQVSDDIHVLALLFAHAEAEYEELPTRVYNATVACSVQAYSDIEVEAKYDWEAVEIAKELAREGGSNVAWDTADEHRVVEVTREEDDETVPGSESLYV